MSPEELYIGGGFDIFHPDHRKFIAGSYEIAKKDYPIRRIVIGLLADEELTLRGSHRPLFPYEWRRDDVLQWFASRPFLGVEGVVEKTYREDFYKGIHRELFAQRVVVINSDHKNKHWIKKIREWHPRIQFVEPIGRFHTTDILNEVQKVGERSRCLYRKVGALLIRNGEIVASGTNGPGNDGSCEDCSKYESMMENFEKTGKIELSPVSCDYAHAEMKCLPYSQSGDDILATIGPCPRCADEIVKHNIRRVVYLSPHSNPLSIDIFNNNGIQHRLA